MKDSRIKAVFGLRAIAVLLVIYVHVLFSPIAEKVGTRIFLGQFWTAVNLFFILSGFILFKPYLLSERSMKTWKDAWGFYKHRFFRLYPLFVINIVFVTIFLYKADPHFLRSAFLTITTLSQFTDSNFYPEINPVLWSLVVEIWFSIVFPVLIVIVNKYGFVKLIIGTLIMSLIIRFLGIGHEFMGGYINHLSPVKDFFLARLDDFVIGMAIAFIYYKTEFIKKLSFLSFFGAIFLIAIGNILWDLVESGSITMVFSIFFNNIHQLGFGLLILYALKEKTLFSKFLSFPVLQWIGIACYSFYIWHFDLLRVFLATSHLKDLAIYFIAVIIVSTASYWFIEKRSTSTHIPAPVQTI